VKSFKLQIGLANYRIKFKKRVVQDGEDCEGLCHYDDKVIDIQVKQPADRLLTTFLHEFCHAAFYELGAEHLADNESFVESMAQNIARAIRALPEDFK
jgi:predicted aminopeptidase